MKKAQRIAATSAMIHETAEPSPRSKEEKVTMYVNIDSNIVPSAGPPPVMM